MTQMAVNVSEDLVVLMGPKDLAVFSLISGNLLWESKLEEEDREFVTLDLSKNGRFIACGLRNNRGEAPNDQKQLDGFIYLFSADGKAMTPRQVFYSRPLPATPRVVSSTAGGCLVVQTGDKIEKVAIR